MKRIAAMKRTALFIKTTQLEALKAQSKKTGAPISEIIRRAIDLYLKASRRS
jgi:hypothetical protein